MERIERLELLLCIVLIYYISFSNCITTHPVLAGYRAVWETSIGTAIRVAAIAFVAVYVSMPVAALFVVNLLRCSDRV